MTNLQTQINEYLFYEFDMDGDKTLIAEDFPFKLRYLGEINVEGSKTEVFEFSDNGEEFYAMGGYCLEFYSKADIDFENLRLQMLGAKWIGNHDPIDLNTSRIGDNAVPSTLERRAIIEKVAAQTFGEQTNVEILEDLFLRRTKKYLILARRLNEPKALLILDGHEPREVNFFNASSWRRLSISIGKMLSSGEVVC